MLKSRCGIVAALAFLYCGSQSDAADGSSSKLMGDRGPGQAEDWVLYADLPEDAGLLSLNSVGDEGEPLLICQSEDGVIGTVSEGQGGAVCDTRDGEEDTFYVLIMGPPVDEDYEDEEESGGIAGALRRKQMERAQGESHGGGGMLPDFDWTEEEKEEIAEALRATDAWQRFVDEATENKSMVGWRDDFMGKYWGMACGEESQDRFCHK